MKPLDVVMTTFGSLDVEIALRIRLYVLSERDSIPSAPVIPCEAQCFFGTRLTHNPKPRLQKGAVSRII